jgi:hypothetical protein
VAKTAPEIPTLLLSKKDANGTASAAIGGYGWLWGMFGYDAWSVIEGCRREANIRGGGEFGPKLSV